MTKILYTKTGAIDLVMISENKHGLSDIELKQIQSYTDQQKKMQRYAGKVLVRELSHRLKDQGETHNIDSSVTQNNLHTNTSLSYSLSHTKGITVCAGINNGKIGIDIEKIKEIDLNLYTDYFTEGEWDAICNNLDSFYQLWTKKEALLKAMGTGFLMDMNKIEVLNNSIIVNDAIYYFHSILLETTYQCTLVTSNETSIVELSEIVL